MKNQQNRRQFIQSTAVFAAGISSGFFSELSPFFTKNKVKVSAHLWAYASQFPPNYDCSPILDQVFSEIKTAGFDGLELKHVNLLADDSVARISALIKKYKLPVSGTSYNADMWNREKHKSIASEANLVIDRLHQVGGETFGVSVGNAKRLKTPAELDAQAELLQQLIQRCSDKGIVLNLHNHTYEVENNLHDLKGTLARIPEVKLGPDLNWLIRAGVDPVWFIQTYGKQMVYMHLRDQKPSGKWAEAMGDGHTDFRAIAAALVQCHFKGRAAVELAFDEPTTRPLLSNWELSRKYVKSIFGW